MEGRNDRARAEEPGDGLDDDLYDGVARDLKSREIASEEGREEGQTVVVEPLPGGRAIVVGREGPVDRFRKMIQQDVVDYRVVVVRRFPTEPAAIEEAVRPALPRLSEARRNRGWPAVGPFTKAVEGAMGLVEEGMEKLGMPLEPHGGPDEPGVSDDG